MIKNDLFLRALKGETVQRPPVWMMRQAGRYLPDFMALKEKYDFFTRCKTPELATEITVMPIDQIGPDAAILFSDILVVLQAMQIPVEMKEGVGPWIPNPIRSQADIDRVIIPDIHEHLGYVMKAIELTQQELANRVPLIGFAGAPWTVATYMIAGRGTPDQKPAHDLKDNNILAFENLIEILTKATIKYLSAQIDAGAEVVKIFDSWAGSLKGDDFYKYALEPTKKIVMELKAKYPTVPIIAFPRQAGDYYKGFLKSTGADCLAIDDSISSAWAAKYLQKDGCIQGNLNSSHMVSGGQNMIDEIETIVSDLSQGPHIFNLGHGITPEANPDNVALMIETIRNFKLS